MAHYKWLPLTVACLLIAAVTVAVLSDGAVKNAAFGFACFLVLSPLYEKVWFDWRRHKNRN